MKNRIAAPWLMAVFLGALLSHFSAQAVDTDNEVRAVAVPDIEALINDNKGKVVVLNFWATWCPPCMKEFPDIVKLYNQYQAKGLAVIAVSMNEEDEIEDINGFVEEHKPPFPVYRAATIDEAFYQGVAKQWLGEMPLTMIFDANTKLAHFHKKELTFAQFEQDVLPLLPAASAVGRAVE